MHVLKKTRKGVEKLKRSELVCCLTDMPPSNSEFKGPQGPTEDVDKDGLDLLVAQENVECIDDLSSSKHEEYKRQSTCGKTAKLMILKYAQVHYY